MINMLQTNTLALIVKMIIAHQAMIIGPLALEQAKKVSGLRIKDPKNMDIEISDSDSNSILTSLVKKYEELFGLASIEECKDAVKEISPPVSADDLPDILR